MPQLRVPALQLRVGMLRIKIPPRRPQPRPGAATWTDREGSEVVESSEPKRGRCLCLVIQAFKLGSHQFYRLEKVLWKWMHVFLG